MWLCCVIKDPILNTSLIGFLVFLLCCFGVVEDPILTLSHWLFCILVALAFLSMTLHSSTPYLSVGPTILFDLALIHPIYFNNLALIPLFSLTTCTLALLHSLALRNCTHPRITLFLYYLYHLALLHYLYLPPCTLLLLSLPPYTLSSYLYHLVLILLLSLPPCTHSTLTLALLST